MVSNNLWAKADVPIGETVCLWLGADIMCEYSFDEAKTLLAKNLSNAKITHFNLSLSVKPTHVWSVES